MKHTVLKNCALLSGLMLLPSCGRIIDWASSAFYQGERLRKEISVAGRHLRTVTVYDQFTTIARVDALWLSAEVKKSYAKAYALQHGKTEEERNIFLRRQLEENNHYISFFVLSLNDMILEDKYTPWNLFLQIDDVCSYYHPVEIKQIDIDPEYAMLLCHKVNKFKTTYLVRFAKKDADDNPLITAGSTKMTLHIRSVEREALLEWNLENGKLLDGTCACKEEDYDPADNKPKKCGVDEITNPCAGV
jgi:hypothetical protein